MINVFGLILLIVITVFVYRTAKDYGKNAGLWALITFGIGFIVQIVLPIIFIVVLAIILMMRGMSQQQVNDSIPSFLITVVFLILSLVAGFLILRKVAQMPEEEPFMPPPSPEEYNQI